MPISDILIVGLLLVITALVVLLYRQRSPETPVLPPVPDLSARVTALEAELETATVQNRDSALKLTKAEEVLLRLRHTSSENETLLTELRQQLEASLVTIASLRGQITTSELGTIESKALYSTVSAVAFDNVFVLNEDLMIIATNKSGDEFFSYKNPVGEQIGIVVASLELVELVARAQLEDEELEEQIQVDSRHYRVRTKRMNYDGVHWFIGVALQEITQLVRLNRARRDMVANISHELRTPIANIRMIIEGLFHEAEKPKRKASISTLRAILRETDSLLWLVQELLDLSMIESGQAIMKLLPNSLLELVTDSTDRLADQMSRKHLNVVIHVPARIRVLCDWEQTRRVLINLIHNAIKWSPEQGAITVSASYQNDEVLITIFDNGPGVPDDQRERIFERFYQVDTSRSASAGGSGLGLAICKHIIEAHGGAIWAEGNSLGAGGRLFFTLLAADEDDYRPQPEMQHGQHDLIPVPSSNNYLLIPVSVEDDASFDLVDDDD